MYSIRVKLVLGISALIVILFTITAFLLINEKEREISHDIYTKARSFSELTAPTVADLYSSLLSQNSFVLFNREIKDIFRKDEDISAITLSSFSGEVLYNSAEEKDRAYEGEKRVLQDLSVLTRVKSSYPSYLLASGRTLYLKKDTEGLYISVDQNEKPVPDIADNDKIINLVYPLDGKYGVIYDVNYDNLRLRVLRTTERIILLLAFGILLGIGFGSFLSGRITNPIEKLRDGALQLAKGDFKTRVDVKTRDEVGVLAATFNKMAQDLEASTKALVFKERIAKELELAARIQSQILPTKLPVIEGLDLSAAIIPAAEIGGDCYDFIQVDPQTHVFYISDVTGHGVPSGIVASVASSLIFSYAQGNTLSDILIHTNHVLKNKTVSNMFMTLLMLRYSPNKLNYVSAGHPEMLHFISSDKKVITEKGGGIALGMVPDISKMVHEETVTFAAGDCIILYSDGIPEAASEKGELYGMQRFKRALSDHGELDSAEAIRNALIADVKEFMGKAEQLDDITLVVVLKKK